MKPKKKAIRKKPKPIQLTMLVLRVDRRNRCFWARASSAPKGGYGLMRHDFSHTELSPIRGQILTYEGGPPVGQLQADADWDTEFQEGRYSVLKHIPNDLLIEVMEYSQFFYGIGRVKLSKLPASLRTRPSRLKNVLAKAAEDEVPDSLVGSGLSDRSLQALVLGYRLTEWLIHCTGIGIDERTCRNFFDVYRWETLKHFEENPFKILAYASSTDYQKLWRVLCKAYPDRKTEAHWSALWVVFYEANVRYQTSISRSQAESQLADMLGTAVAQETLGQVLASRHLSERAGDLQLWANRRIEEKIAELLRALNAHEHYSAPHGVQAVDWDAAIGNLGSRDDLRPEMLAAQLRSFEQGQMLLIYGEAGTGKTFLSARLLSQCYMAGWALWIIAVSNIAVSRVRKELEPLLQSCGNKEKKVNYASLARFLSVSIKEDDPPHILLMDEASMIGAGQAFEALSKLRPCDRLIMVGDSRQIPPIGWGAVFHSLETVSKPCLNRIVLTDRKRQQGGGRAILDLIAQLEDGQSLRSAVQGKEQAIELLSPDRLPLDRLEAYLLSLQESGSHLNSETPPIICLCREDVSQANWLCRQLRARIDAKKPRAPKYGYAAFREGEPVINTVNRPSVGIWNGSRGRVVKCQGMLKAQFEVADGTMLFNHLDSGIERAYAITVHRAQGEGHDTVILYLGPDVPETLLHRGALYTALTRASRKLVIIANPEHFDEGYTRPNNARETNFLKLALSTEPTTVVASEPSAAKA